MSAQFAETNIEETVHHAVSFTASNTYIGLPQMKAYNAINIRWAPTRDRCFDFMRFLTIFGKNILALYSKTNVMITFLHKLAVV
jgi:hypothetical protein